MRRLTQHTATAILLTLLFFGCGTECGNPTCGGVANLNGSPNASGDAVESEAFDGSNPFIVSQVSNDVTARFTSLPFDYQIDYPVDWTLDESVPSVVTLSNGLISQFSKITITSTTLTDPITDLLSFAAELQPIFSWFDLTTNGFTGVFTQTATTFGEDQYRIFLTQDLILLQVDIARNVAANGVNDVNAAINSLTFIGTASE